jgi:ATP-dependent RNA helicase DeaD
MNSDPLVGQSFESLGLKPELVSVLVSLGYEEATPIQAAAIPALLSGKDVVAQAATGTGKTGAFALPMLQRLPPQAKPNRPSALVLVPTRELAMQVTEAINRYGSNVRLGALAIYGGQEISKQLRPLSRGVNVVVATPGRALDHMRRKTLRLEDVQVVVLDEADEMLDLGFAEDLDIILSELPETRQTALFSATLPARIASIAEKHLTTPMRIRIEPPKADPSKAPQIVQTVYTVPRGMKDAALLRILQLEMPKTGIVFCRTRLEVERLSEALNQQGFQAVALHGGMSQEQRDRVLSRFKKGSHALLVATDVAARGLHVDNLSHVFNHDLPNSPETYVHRIGRTGRAGKEGRAVTLVEPREVKFLRAVERAAGAKLTVQQVPSASVLAKRQIERTVEQVKKTKSPSADIVTAWKQLTDSLEADQAGALAVAALHLALHPPMEGDDGNFKVADTRGAERAGPASFSKDTRRPDSRGRASHSRESTPRDEGFERAPKERATRAAGPMQKLFISVGNAAGIRPGDLVGAIANEANISSREIGAITIGDTHSTVEVSAKLASQVVEAMANATLRGKRMKVSLDRGGAPSAKPEALAPRPPPSKAKPFLPKTAPAKSFDAPPAPRRSSPKAPGKPLPPSRFAEKPKQKPVSPRFFEPEKKQRR